MTSLKKSDLVYQYELDDLLARVAYEKRHQRDALERNIPDIEAFFRRPLVAATLFKIQELVWTIRSYRNGRKDKKNEEIISSPIAIDASESEYDFSRKRILLDVTATYSGKVYGGIKSATLSLAKAAIERDIAIPVVIENDRVRRYGPDGLGGELTTSKNDIYVILDHYWDAFSCYPKVIDSLRADGVTIATCIYDLIPLDYPSLIDPNLTRQLFDQIRPAVKTSDILFSISQSSANDISRYLHQENILRSANILWFHLGVDFKQSQFGNVRQSIKDHFLPNKNNYLSVGSMMPHKAHRFAIQAFEKLWANGAADRYIIAGPKATESATEDFIRSHPMFGTLLFRIDDASDEEIVWAYRHATCLIQPSIIEGFGLPIIEANANGLPIIASDIPVFREIGCDSLIYFDVCDKDMLSTRIREFSPDKSSTQKTKSTDWQASITILCNLLHEEAEMVAARGHMIGLK